MADIIHTMQQKAAKHSPASDRVALEAVNELLQEAMRAGWTLHVSRAGIDTEVGRTLGHAAVLAWANCENALQDLRLMSEVNPHIRDAATRLEDLLPPGFPDGNTLGRHFAKLLARAKEIKKADAELAELIQTTGCLINIFHANRDLIMVRSAA